MGTTACRGKGFKGGVGVSGEGPIGAAMVSYPPPPPPDSGGLGVAPCLGLPYP